MVFLQEKICRNVVECTRCNITHETISHKFWSCLRVKNFWTNIYQWLVESGAMSRSQRLDERTVLFGLGKTDIVNHVIIIAKQLIQENKALCLELLKKFVAIDRTTEETIARISGNLTNFERKWGQFAYAGETLR